MDKAKVLQAIKGGLKGEMDSINLYQQAAEHAGDEVKTFLLERVREEKRHYNYLLQYYQDIELGNDISDLKLEDKGYSPIINAEFLKRIAENQYLFSAMSTAVLLELNAINYYKNCAEESELQELKNFYNLLVKWETLHYDEVLKIQKEAEQYFWTENRFQPF